MKKPIKYGLWFAGIYFLLLLILLQIDDFGIIIGLVSPGFYSIFLIFQEGMNSTTKYVFRTIISIFSWFLLGSFIGWIVGKFKKKE